MRKKKNMLKILRVDKCAKGFTRFKCRNYDIVEYSGEDELASD